MFPSALVNLLAGLRKNYSTHYFQKIRRKGWHRRNHWWHLGHGRNRYKSWW